MSTIILFPDSDKSRPILPNERILRFFQLIMESKMEVSSFRETHCFITTVLAEVEQQAAKHNKVFRSDGGEPKHMKVPLMGEWHFISRRVRDIFYTITHKQYLIMNSTGAFQIHQFNPDYKLTMFPERYRNNDHETLILTWPSSNREDVWHMPLEFPQENFSKYNKEH